MDKDWRDYVAARHHDWYMRHADTERAKRRERYYKYERSKRKKFQQLAENEVI